MLATAEHYFWLIESHRLKKKKIIKGRDGGKNPNQHLKHLSLLYFLSMTPVQQQVSDQYSMPEGITLLTASSLSISEAPGSQQPWPTNTSTNKNPGTNTCLNKEETSKHKRESQENGTVLD